MKITRTVEGREFNVTIYDEDKTIQWGSYGEVSAEQARQYGEMLIEASEIIQKESTNI
jgi:hypothetical protein